MADSDIQGTVTDSSDNPVNGAVVYLLPEGVGPNNAIKTTTDSNGDYIFDGHPDGDGTSKQWHVAAYYEDQNSNLFNAFSKPNVSASLPKQSVIPDNVVEDFERPSPLADYSGDTGGWSVETGSPIESSKSITSTAGSAGSSSIVRSDTSIPQNNGEPFSALIRLDGSSTTAGIMYGAQDANNYYGAYISNDSNTLAFILRDGGSFTDPLGSTTSFTPSTGTVYDLEVKWDGTNHTANVYEWSSGSRTSSTPTATTSISDSTYSSGDIGWFAFGSGNSKTVDYYRI